MDVSESLQKYGLVPSDEALPHIRALLSKEADAERNDLPRVDDLALLCCVQLFSRGYLEDILRIWDAKRSGFDLGTYLDIQLLCGAGLEATKRFLSSREGEIAADALQYLQECEKAGDFDDFSPEAYLERYRRYFGLDRSGRLSRILIKLFRRCRWSLGAWRRLSQGRPSKS